jgi:hypothetical protein
VPAAGNGRWWKVARVQGGELVVINTVQEAVA